MDQIGSILRAYLDTAHKKSVVKASCMAEEMASSGMRRDQAYEMLLASGFTEEVSEEALEGLSFRKRR